MNNYISNLFRILNRQDKELFVIVDAARDNKVIEFLIDVLDELNYESLFNDETQTIFATVAPYLVLMSKKSNSLETLIDSGWGKSWGIFFTSNDSFQNVKNHFHQQLFAVNEDGKELFFRYYDPRVFRMYISSCNHEQKREFFGPVEYFFVEGENSHILIQYGINSIKNINL